MKCPICASPFTNETVCEKCQYSRLQDVFFGSTDEVKNYIEIYRYQRWHENKTLRLFDIGGQVSLDQNKVF